MSIYSRCYRFRDVWPTFDPDSPGVCVLSTPRRRSPVGAGVTSLVCDMAFTLFLEQLRRRIPRGGFRVVDADGVV